MKPFFRSFVPLLVLAGCTLPPIRREPQTPGDVVDAGEDAEEQDAQDFHDDATVADVRAGDTGVVPDGVIGGDAGVSIPSMVRSQRVFEFPLGSSLPFTSSPGASKIVAHPAGLVATAWVLPFDGTGAHQRVFTRGRFATDNWTFEFSYPNVPSPSALAMAPITNTLLLGITCSGDCHGGIPISPLGVQSGVVSIAPRGGGAFNFASPSAVSFDNVPSAGIVSLAVQRGGNEYYYSHLTPGAMGVRRFRRSASADALTHDLSSLGMVPAIAVTETTATGRVFHGIGGSTGNLLQSSSFQYVGLLETGAGVLRVVALQAPQLVMGAHGSYPLFMAGLESSRDGTLYAHIHGRFANGECTYLYRFSTTGTITTRSLGCHEFTGQLQVIDDNQLLFVEAIGGAAGLRIGYSANRGETWSWRDVSVLSSQGLMLGELFTAPSLVRPATSPDGFESRKVRLVFSVGSAMTGMPRYTSMEYVEFTL